MQKKLPLVVIAGRPNVGKSTLFNKLIGRSLAITHDQPGITRDWRQGLCLIAGHNVAIIDTAGLDDEAQSDLDQDIQKKNLKIVEQADLILFVVDAKAGLTNEDRQIHGRLKRLNIPTWLIANKIDDHKNEDLIYDFYALGYDHILPISAEHRLGIEIVREAVQQGLNLIPKEDKSSNRRRDRDPEHESKAIKLAIIGQPNVGKSTLINALLGDDRLVTSSIAGTTRDTIKLDFTYAEQDFEIFDTAGLAKISALKDVVSEYSKEQSLSAIRFAHVVVLVIDGSKPYEKQDFALLSHIIREGRAFIILLNKSDLYRSDQSFIKSIRQDLEQQHHDAKGAIIKTTSAKLNKGLHDLMDTVLHVHEQWNRRIPTNKLNTWLKEVLSYHPPRMHNGRQIRIKYVSQINTRPPTFAFFGNQVDKLPSDYKSYLQNLLREEFDLNSIPLRTLFRSPENPYDKN